MNTAIVFGPQGCGKTSHARLIAQLLAIPEDKIIDDWDGRYAEFKHGHLHLTSGYAPPGHTNPPCIIRSFDSFNFPRFTPNHDEIRRLGLGLIGSEIILERLRQIEEYDYDASHDDAHHKGEIAAMAAAYSLLSTNHENKAVQEKVQLDFWPWDETMPTHHSRRDLLITAAALLVAEIERIDRAEPVQAEG